MRLKREEKVEQNREALLQAARRVFLERGYTGASLEGIADEAGFSKGVVYSQFESKADLFLALLDRRIDERAERNRQVLAGERRAGAGIAEAIALSERLFLAEPEWTLLVVEFRVHAARDAELNRRYAAAHARTVERLAGLFAEVLEKAGREPAFPPRTLAEAVLAFGIGIELERIADPASLPTEAVVPMIEAIFGLDAGERPKPRAGRRTTRRKRP